MLCKGNLTLATAAAGCDDAVAEAKPTLQTEADRFSENLLKLAFSRRYLKLIKVSKNTYFMGYCQTLKELHQKKTFP